MHKILNNLLNNVLRTETDYVNNADRFYRLHDGVTSTVVSTKVDGLPFLPRVRKNVRWQKKSRPCSSTRTHVSSQPACQWKTQELTGVNWSEDVKQLLLYSVFSIQELIRR